MEKAQLQKIANDLRIDIVRMIGEAGSGHPGGSLSCADILTALYFGGVMEHDPSQCGWSKRDRFILAKGHAAPALYAALAHSGYFPREELITLRKITSRLQGHPDSNLVPGVEISTGSLGQGLSIAAGLAAGLKLNGEDQAVFTLLGDGECQEGQVWEAAMFAAHRNLDNLIAIVDYNQLQIDGYTCDVCDLGDLVTKFKAFSWDVTEVDGHNIESLVTTFAKIKEDCSSKPHVVIAHTVKGKGVSFMENQACWHGVAPKPDELARALSDLGFHENSEAGVSVDSCGAERGAGQGKDESSLSLSDEHVAQLSYSEQENERLKVTGRTSAIVPRLQINPNAEKKATRAAYGITLTELANEGLKIVAVDADLSCSTTTKKYADAKPEYANRVFNCGIAEQNMIDVAAGLSLAGYIAFTGSFAVFGTGRVYDQIRNTVCYSKLNVKIAPTHAGISVGPDGGSHQMLEDISLMRSLPNMRVLVPADYAAAESAVRLAAQTPGPVYIRMGRAAVPCVYEDGVELSIGGAYVLREGTDVTIAACGVEVEQALKAADLLAAKGICAEVIDAFSIKPLGAQVIISSVAKTGAIVTAEEHSIIGGLGSAVAEALSSTYPAPLAFIGVYDQFGKSGSYEELSACFHMDASAIVEAAKNVIARKSAC